MFISSEKMDKTKKIRDCLIDHLCENRLIYNWRSMKSIKSNHKMRESLSLMYIVDNKCFVGIFTTKSLCYLI